MKEKVGKKLVEIGYVTLEQLKEAIIHKEKFGGLVGIILCKLNYLTEQQLVQALSLVASETISKKK